jgi:hypothetical protein
MASDEAMNGLLILGALGLAILAAGPQATAQPKECRVVHGRYAIYVNNDALWVSGSKHLLEVGITELDKELQARGWEDTVVYGDFTLCSVRLGDPTKLTIRDPVEVTGYTHLVYRHRDTGMWVR